MYSFFVKCISSNVNLYFFSFLKKLDVNNVHMTTVNMHKKILSIGESPSIYPFLKNNGHEAPNNNAIIFQEWTDTRTFSYLKYTLIYNYV